MFASYQTCRNPCVERTQQRVDAPLVSTTREPMGSFRLRFRERTMGEKEGILGSRLLSPEFPYTFADFSGWGPRSTKYGWFKISWLSQGES